MPNLSKGYFANIVFDMNRAGDAVVSWGYGGDTIPSNAVTARSRPAGGTWEPAQTIVSGGHETPDDVSVGQSGAAVIAWESFGYQSTTATPFILYAASQSAPGAAWQNSAALAGQQGASFGAKAAVDAAAQAAITFKRSSSTYAAVTQPSSGAAWSAPTAISPPTNGNLVFSALKTDYAGDATFLFIDQSQTRLYSVRGNLATNNWNAPDLVFGSRRTLNYAVLDVASNGRAIVATAPFDGNIVQAQTRTSPAGAWGPPVKISRTPYFPTSWIARSMPRAQPC